MKTQVASALFAATLALGGLPSLASAATAPADTIAVLQTSVKPVQYVINATDGSVANDGNVLHVQFANRGDVTATAIEFQVNSPTAESQSVEDVGTFSKDAIVNQSFSNVGDRNSTVSVIGVKYADGSEWSATGQQPFVTRRQAAAVAPIAPAGPYIPEYN
jgi:hypothetical protein